MSRKLHRHFSAQPVLPHNWDDKPSLCWHSDHTQMANWRKLGLASFKLSTPIGYVALCNLHQYPRDLDAAVYIQYFWGMDVSPVNSQPD